ncbi:hypothetical protein BJY04DRAFT_220780 [Aspergillus karnatakaensis]|uniref:uncharacterized protein n=1 Tax=Aspergillus karnatakaensis TaxID=1810916 RepID=UPI003CCD6BA8
MHFTLAAVAALVATARAMTLSTRTQNVNLYLDNLVDLVPTADTPETYYLYLTNYRDYNASPQNPCIYLGEVTRENRVYTIPGGSIEETVLPFEGYTVRASHFDTLTSASCSDGMIAETDSFAVQEYNPNPSDSPNPNPIPIPGQARK